MAEALLLVKRDLGADAVILHTRTSRKGGWMGFGGRTVVEVTAGTDVNVAPRQRSTRTARPTRANQVAVEMPEQRTPSSALRRAYRSSAPAPVDDSPAPPVAGESGSRIATTAAVASPPLSQTATDPQLANELQQLRRLMGRLVRHQGDTPRPDLPEHLFEQYLALLEQEVGEELVEEVVTSVRAELGTEELADPERVRQSILKALAQLIPAEPTDPIEQKDAQSRPRTIALIGPTGVGKTTTVAKLAATFKLQHKLNVSLITIDTYRIAAVEQLKTYAQIIGVPLHVVLTPLELKQAIARCRDCDVVLIDTAGRSQHDREKLSQLKSFIEAAQPDEVHLVLASTGTQKVLMQAIERFSEVRTDRIIFTKLDEAVSFGVLVNVIRRVNKRLSFVTTGQEVPHQIEPGRGERLAGLILGESL